MRIIFITRSAMPIRTFKKEFDTAFAQYFSVKVASTQSIVPWDTIQELFTQTQKITF